MKKTLLVFGFIAVSMVTCAEVEFAYEAGAEVMSAYLWRGFYNGGLSFQPQASVGFDHDHIQFRAGVWATMGATDWRFQKGLEESWLGNPNTYFMPEVDIMASVRTHGVSAGFTHYYYCNGPYLNAGSIEKATEGTSQTEVYLGIDGDDWLPESHHAYINWYTMVSGNDANYEYDELTGLIPVDIKRAYSSYLEIGYDYTFSQWDLTIGGQLGIVPWRSEKTYQVEKATVKCLAVKINKAWDMGVCEIDLYAQGMLDPYDVNRDNVHISASGDVKLYQQKLNGTIGMGVWF